MKRLLHSLLMVSTACAAAVPTSCASPAQVRTPLPTVSVRPPISGIPEPVAAFSGVWSGRWDRFGTQLGAGPVSIDHALVVESIVEQNNGVYGAAVIYSWGESPGYEPGFTRTRGTISPEGLLRVGPFRARDHNDGSQATYRLSTDRKTLSVELAVQGAVVSGTLWRTRLQPPRGERAP